MNITPILIVKHEIDPNKKVWVYRNLQKGLWSVMQGGRVVAHAERVYLRDVTYHVRPAGRDKVRATKQKNVHAFVVGYWIELPVIRAAEIKYLKDEDDTLPYFGVVYDPYDNDTFINEDHDAAIYHSDWVDMDINCTMKVMAMFTPDNAERYWPARDRCIGSMSY